jgi:hypothetical protein
MSFGLVTRIVDNAFLIPDFHVHKRDCGKSFVSRWLVLKGGGHEGEAIGVED